MDAKEICKNTKQKFVKNKKWDKKYKPRNAASNKNTKPFTKEKNKKLSDHSDESEDEPTLKQHIPVQGWFPESESSSSDFEDFIHSFSNKTCDKNWFDKELDDVQLNSEVPAINKNLKENKSKKKLAVQDAIRNNSQASSSKTKTDAMKKCIDKKNSETIDTDEEELDFLLSLREPVHTGPINVMKNIENERKFAVQIKNNIDEKVVKSIDLEKWLDSVLDD